MKAKTPQEKKALSYAKDRRNDYGANDKASRKSIPKRKAAVNRAYRHKVETELKHVRVVENIEDTSAIDDAVRSVKKSNWKKWPDAPLGEVVERKLHNRPILVGQGKTARKETRKFIEELRIDVEELEPGKWFARAKDYPHLSAFASDAVRVREKLRHIAEVAKRNELGADIRIQIDGNFITPRLTR